MRLSGWLAAILAAVMLVGAACGGSDDASRKEGGMAEQDPMYEFRTDVLQVASRLSERDFVTVVDYAEIPGQVYFQTVNWAKEVFRDGQGPFGEQGEAEHAFHVARPGQLDFDLVRHRYRSAGCAVTVLEGAGFYHIRCAGFDPRAFGGSDPAKQAAAVTAAFLQATPSDFSPLPPLEDGSIVLSTSPDMTLTVLKNWSDRIDAIGTADALVLILYKRHLSLEEMIDFSKWFPDEFRQEQLSAGGRTSPDDSSNAR